MYPYIFQGDNLVIVIDGESHTVHRSHLNFNAIMAAIKNRDWDSVPNLVNPERIVVTFGQGNVQVRDSKVYWQGRELHNALTKQIVRMIRDGFDVEPLVRFMDNLMLNPSNRAVEELYGFLEVGALPITPDGCFLAYKRVNADYTDIHSRTVLNKPAALMSEQERHDRHHNPVQTGEVSTTVVWENDTPYTVVSMTRNAVDDDRTCTCSHGLHFCSKEYLQHFRGERLLILRINPADVVSIPADYNQTKGRTCRYTVVGEIGGEDVSIGDSVTDWNDDTLYPENGL